MSVAARRRLAGAAAFALLLLLPGAAAPLDAAAQTVRGVVTDAETAAPLVGARVTLRDAAGTSVAAGITDGEGRVVLPAAAGRYTLAASHLDYLSIEPLAIELRASEELLIELRLSRSVVVLEPLVVTGRRHDPRHDASRAGMLARRALFGESWNQMVLMHGDGLMYGTSISELLRRLPTSISTRCRIYFWEGNLVTTLLEAAMLADRHPEHFGAVEFYRTWHDAPQAYRQAPSYVPGSPLFCSIVALWSRPEEPGSRRTKRWLAFLASAVVASTVILLTR